MKKRKRDDSILNLRYAKHYLPNLAVVRRIDTVRNKDKINRYKKYNSLFYILAALLIFSLLYLFVR